MFLSPAPLLQVVSALESNPTARRTQLHHKFEQVIALVEDNIYECCSEAWTSQGFFSTSHLFLLLTAAFFLTKAIWKWCPPKQKPFLKCCYFWKGVKSGRAKDLNLWSTIFFSRPLFLLLLFLLISECQEMILNVSLRHRQTYSLAQLYREHGGALHFWTLQWVGPTVSPGGNLKHWTLFLRANESQWCTALYYNVHSNIYRCVI